MCSGHKPSSYSLVNPFMDVNGVWKQFKGYTAQIQADFLANVIRGSPADQPFFAMYTPTSPHVPANDDRYASLPVSPLRDAAYDQETRRGTEPVYMRRPPFDPARIAAIDSLHAAMTRAVRALDDSVATLLSSLGTREQDTIVFYLSDNGILYGEHRWSTKKVPYEESVRVPFVVRYPALHPESRPSVSDALVQNVDIAPTVAELAGLPWGADGRSLVPILDGSSAGMRDAALLESCRGTTGRNEPCYGFYRGSAPEVPAFWGLVTERFKYVRYITGEEELYDLSTDPAELHNLAGVAAFVEEVKKLRRELAGLRAPPPVDTTIVTGPSGPLDGRVAAFTFFSQSAFASYRCRLDRDGVPGEWHPCNGGSDVEGSLADGSYVFEAAGTDERGFSDPTPATRSFTVQSTGPVVEIVSAPATDLTAGSASFSFASPTAGATFECRLAPLPGSEPPWAPCDPTTGVAYSSLGEGRWSFEVRARDPATGAVSDPPSEFLFRVDQTGPVMTFGARPPLVAASERARFSFLPDEPTAGPVVCLLDHRAPVDCSAGSFEAQDLREGDHRLRVSATDALGNAATTLFEWLVDRTPPRARFTKGPRDHWAESTATFRLRFTNILGGFTCKLDGRPFMMCPKEPFFDGLHDGEHKLTVIAFDDAHNASTPVTWIWVQDTGAPSITVSGGPSGVTNSTSVSFSLTASEPGTFECSFEGGPFVACASPVNVSGLVDGQHAFAARTRDLAGNLSEPVAVTWTVDTRPPITTIVSGPPDPSASTSATFTFSADEPGVAFSCSLDGGAAQSCVSGTVYSDLAPGAHVFVVHATDAAGNIGPDATWSWTIA